MLTGWNRIWIPVWHHAAIKRGQIYIRILAWKMVVQIQAHSCAAPRFDGRVCSSASNSFVLGATDALERQHRGLSLQDYWNYTRHNGQCGERYHPGQEVLMDPLRH